MQITPLRSRWNAALAVCLALPVTTLAQSMTGDPAVDSAAVARASFAVAAKASRDGDGDATMRALDRAARAWPTQESYVWYQAVIAARRGDTSVMVSALRRYADLGLGRELRDTVFDRYRTLPEFAALERRHHAQRQQWPRSAVLATLTDSALWPESVDVDPTTGALYVSSVRRRTIVERDRAGRERRLIPPMTPGVGSIMGVRVAGAGLLWATSVGMRAMEGWTPADTTAALLQVRIADGAIVRRVPLPPGAPHMPGDLAVGPGGEVLVTDSDTPLVYRLRPGADSLEPIASPLFRSLQGVAYGVQPGVAYLADYSHGLLRLDLATGSVARLAEPPHTTTLGIDGIAMHGNAIIAIQNGVSPARVMRFALDGAGTTIERAEVIDRNTDIADEPTIGTIVGNQFIYVANSQWAQYAPDGTRRAGAELKRPVLLALPLEPR